MSKKLEAGGKKQEARSKTQEARSKKRDARNKTPESSPAAEKTVYNARALQRSRAGVQNAHYVAQGPQARQAAENELARRGPKPGPSLRQA